MKKALLAIRFQGLFAGLTAQNAKRNKPQSKGMLLLYVALYLYVVVVFGGMMCMTFHSLAPVYHQFGLDWLYFSIAGMLGFALSLFGSVFTTQNQLYDAKDNDLLLSMPIPPKAILLSRMLPLLAMNFLFCSIVMIPASVMYGMVVEFSFIGILLQLLTLIGICFLSQAVACLLGWLLHLLLQKMNKSAASMLYLVAFLGIYFYLYSQANTILQGLAMNGQQIADIVQSWVWPLYAMGLGCLEQLPYCLGFLTLCSICFAGAYWFLSATFLRTATASHRSIKKRKLDMSVTRPASPIQAITAKELHKFLGCPVYLTNMGLGVILTAALPVVSIILRDKIAALLPLLESLNLTPLVICAVLSFATSTCCISNPSVSLEGKNIWILKSMPVSPREILLAKLNFHVWMTVPVSMVAGFAMAITFDCSPMEILLVTLIPGLLALTNGLLGLWAGVKFAKLDYINEAYPCKQSISVMIAMFGMMGLCFVLGLGYWLLMDVLSPVIFMALTAVILTAICFGFYRLIMTQGIKKWESL